MHGPNIDWAMIRRRLLELLPANRIGIGSERDRMLMWWVRDEVITIAGATDALPSMSLRSRSTESFATGDGERTIRLLPAPEAGLDTVGSTAAAVLERFAEDRTITGDDTVTTLATLARVGDLGDALERAKSRWREDARALAVIARAAQRVGLQNPPADPDLPGYEPLE
jgi:hypothetical protein